MSERALLVMRAQVAPPLLSSAFAVLAPNSDASPPPPNQGEFRGFSQLDAADGPAAPEFGVFIDFMCVHQIRAEECNTPQETGHLRYLPTRALRHLRY